MTSHAHPWEVPRAWDGETCFVLAGGPSVLEWEPEIFRGKNVIAVNSSYERFPFAPYLFFCDLRWWRHHEKRLQDFAGQIVTNGPIVPIKGQRRPLILGRAHPRDGALTLNPRRVVVGKTSTHGAINLAIHLGAQRIVLVGVDMGAVGGKTWHHDPHPWPPVPGCFERQMGELSKLAKAVRELTGVEIVNASPHSLLTCWPKMSLERFL